MSKVIRIINGMTRQVDDTAAPPIYDESLLVVSDNPEAGEIVGPIATGTPISLPDDRTYSSDELEIYVNGQRVEPIFDYNYVGSIPRTQISFTFDIELKDIIRFRIDRGA